MSEEIKIKFLGWQMSEERKIKKEKLKDSPIMFSENGHFSRKREQVRQTHSSMSKGKMK